MKDLIALTSRGFLQNKRYIVNSGGTRSGKTHATLSVLFHIANSRNVLISVVSETFPHLRKGAIRDFKEILEQMNVWQDEYWNKSESTYTIPHKGTIEFFSADTSDKVHGPERDILFINEGQNVPYEIVRHLLVRTTGAVFIDFNPTREFWVHDYIKEDTRTLWIHSTYLDNPFLSKEQVYEIEKNKVNKQWWAVYGEGKIAESDGAVYSGWKLIDYIPTEARLVRYGLDFGYTNDPTSVIGIYKYNDEIILDEVLYRKGMNNSEIAKFIKNLPEALVIADSAEPKSIDELQLYGVDIIPATKGQGSVNQGIDAVKTKKISLTKSSTNTIKEYRNYLWKVKDEKRLNVPEDLFNHSMDAIRYAITDLYPIEDPKPVPKDDRIKGTYVPYTTKKNNSESSDFYENTYNPADSF